MVELTINLNPTTLDRLKAGLRLTAPKIKSSHRAEALARSLGFATNAELRARLHEEPTPRCLNPKAFSAYLSERGLPDAASLVLRAAAHAIILNIMDRDDRFHMWGWGSGRPERRDNGRWETNEEHYQRFQAYREELKSVSATEEVLRSIALLSRVPATKTIRPDTDSRRLKHIAENLECRYPDGEDLGPGYVANGSLIVAAAHLGFRYRTGQGPDGWDWPNVTFNMSQAHLLELDIETRPNGARAQDRQRRNEARRYRDGWRSLGIL